MEGNEQVSFQRLAAGFGSLGGMAYPAAVAMFALGTMVGIPATLLLLATVASFGFWRGAGLAILGATLGACGSFWLARELARDWVSEWLGGHPALTRLDQQIADLGGWVVLWLRVLPSLPFTLFNLLCGLSKIHFSHFAAATLVGVVPGTLAYGWAADQLLRFGGASEARPHPLPAVLALLLVAALSALSWWAKRWQRNRPVVRQRAAETKPPPTLDPEVGSASEERS